MKFFYISFVLFYLYLTTGVSCTFNNLLSQFYCQNENCYEVLGVREAASAQEIKTSYIRKIRYLITPNDVAQRDKVNRAYKILMNKRKRTYYDYYLKNPDSALNIFNIYLYWFFRMLNALFLTIVFIGLLTAIQYLHNKYKIRSVLNLCVNSKIFKKEVKTRIIDEHPEFNTYDEKTKRKIEESIKEQIAIEMVMINNEKVKKLEFKDLLIVRFLCFPQHFIYYILWNLRWVLNYIILKKEYSEEDKEYITRKHLKLSASSWEALDEYNKKMYLKRALWIKENLKEYLEEQKEIERMNKLSSSKYKRQMRNKKKGVSFNYND